MARSASPPIYQVKKIPDHQQLIDGKGTASLWTFANLLTQFSYPWNDGLPPTTQFRALRDSTFLYFIYHAMDAGISQKATLSRPVIDADRVEIFFKRADDMNPYYSLEMDALGRVLSTKNRFYRNIDMNWKWPAGHFELMASMNETGYVVEGKISLDSLRQLNLLDGNIIKAGLFRGEYFYGKNGIEEVKWISWVKPDSTVPDFHIASAFGVLELLENGLQII